MKRFLFITLFLTVLLGISSVMWAVNIPPLQFRDTCDESTINNNIRYDAGDTGTLTVHSPNSLDGAFTHMWGFYKNTSNLTPQTVYGTGYFSGGYATINYTYPSDYASGLSWAIDARYSPDNKHVSALNYPSGFWGQFETRDPDGITVEAKAYTFDQYNILSTGASYRVSGNSGTVFPDPALAGSVVDVLRPWSGTLQDYISSGYQANPKSGLYPTYLTNKGYSIEVLETSGAYEKLRLYKDDIEYSVELFGYKNPSGSDPQGYIWWATLENMEGYDADYDPTTGIFSTNFTDPLDLDTVYFLNPWVFEWDSAAEERWWYITTGGGTDLLLSGSKPTGPVEIVRTGVTYNTIQDAIDEANPNDVIEVAPGTYSEAIELNKPNITLRSTDGNSVTIIDRPAGSYTTAVKILGNLGTVTIDGFTVQGWTESGIVQGMASGPGTTVHVLNNIVTSNGLYMRNGIQVSGNNSTVIGNTVVGAHLTEDWAGSGIHVVNASNVTVDNNVVSNADIGICITNWNGPAMSIFDIEGNTLNNNKEGIRVAGLRPTDTITDITISENTISNSSFCGVNLSSDSVIFDTRYIGVSGNVFSDNLIDVSVPVGNESRLDPIWTGNTYDDSVIYLSYIMGEDSTLGTAVMYVDVPDEVIKPNTTQTYSVKMTSQAALHGFTVNVEIPKKDFQEFDPQTFALVLGEGTENSAPLYNLIPDQYYWIYEVSGAVLNNDPGVGDFTLFTFEATSKENYSNVVDSGNYIFIDFDSVVLEGVVDGTLQDITLLDSHDGLVVIDNADPTIEITNSEDYPSSDVDPYLIPWVDEGLVAPSFNLTYTDDWDLKTTMYKIVLDGDDIPFVAANFTQVVGTVNGKLTAIDWTLPITELGDGTYTLYLLATDEADNPASNAPGNFTILPWKFIIDTAKPAPLVWDLCRTTADADISVDLTWAYDSQAVPHTIHVWALDCYTPIDAELGYPVYAPAQIIDPANIVNDIDLYTIDPGYVSTLGWRRVAVVNYGSEIDVSTSNVTATLSGVRLSTGLNRGNYYFTIFGVAENGQVSEAPGTLETPATSFYRESISYWPANVSDEQYNEGLAMVDFNDKALLSGVWGLISADPTFNTIIDVGPTVGRHRRGRPTPDGKINIEDLMILSMNYKNTNYNQYTRNADQDEIQPIKIEMQSVNAGDLMTVNLYLNDNLGQLKGLSIPLQFGSGLTFEALESGSIWPEASMMLYTIEDNVLELSASTLGLSGLAEDNGLIASLNFRIQGQATDLELLRMTARDNDNSDIEILGNPTSGPTDNEDLVEVIPAANFLGSNYPNPFNPTTTIQFGLKQAQNVKITIYNTRGQIVKQLVNGIMPAGTHNLVWDGRDNNNQAIASGMYFYRMETPDYSKTNKAILMK